MLSEFSFRQSPQLERSEEEGTPEQKQAAMIEETLPYSCCGRGSG